MTQLSAQATLPSIRQWWHTWVGRSSIHVPWVLWAFAYAKFLASAQGRTSFEYPVERPFLSAFVVGLPAGICVFLAWNMSVDHRQLTTPAGTLPVVIHRGRLEVVACFAVLLGFCAAGILPPMAGAGQVGFYVLWLAMLFGYGLMFSITLAVLALFWSLGRALNISSLGILRAAVALMIVLAFYGVGILLVTYRINDVTVLGSHAIVACGLLLVTLLCQAIIYLLMMLGCLRALWLLAAAAVALNLWQDPLPERANPLLAAASNVERANGRCAALSVALMTADPSPGKHLPNTVDQPRILISAEGGGIRAAYWTALSLEELSEARKIPLTVDTDILSGVSGGSLGIATFLAAQDLPLAARLPCIREFLAGDFLSPLAAGLLFLDLPRIIIPTSMLDTHRGDHFEDFIARRWLALTGRDYFYRQLNVAAGQGAPLPAVYFNATDALSGRYVALRAPQAGGVGGPDLDAFNTRVLQGLADLRIAQAVHMSARFPYLSPSPDLRAPVNDVSQVLYGQIESAKGQTGNASLASLVDGGYFDNSGLWPAFRLLESERAVQPKPKRYALHIVNDQVRNCTNDPSNTGCVHAVAESLKERLDSGGGWLTRPMQAIVAVQSQHALQNVEALALAKPPTEIELLLWKVPMQAAETPRDGAAAWILDHLDWLPVHGRDLRFSDVALAWTLAPKEREFLCTNAAAIRQTAVPGITSSAQVDRSKDCAASSTGE